MATSAGLVACQGLSAVGVGARGGTCDGCNPESWTL